MVNRTRLPLGPRMRSTTLLNFQSTTSTGSASSCATATMRSPGLIWLLRIAGPGLNSWTLQYPSSDRSSAPMPNSDKFMLMAKFSRLDLPK